MVAAQDGEASDQHERKAPDGWSVFTDSVTRPSLGDDGLVVVAMVGHGASSRIC